MTWNGKLKVWFGFTQFEIQIGTVVLGLATSHCRKIEVMKQVRHGDRP